MNAIRMPKDSAEEKAARKQAMGDAAVVAAEIPLETMRQALAVMELAVTAASKGNRNAASDGGVAALFGRAAIRAADMNVRVNLPSIPDEDVRTRLATEADEILARAGDLEAQAVEATGL